MILGRPTNLWLGLMTTIVGALTVSLVALGFDAVVVATIGGAWGGVGGAVIALLAGRPPTLQPGDTFHVETPAGTPNYTTVVAAPPAQDPPPVPHEPVP